MQLFYKMFVTIAISFGSYFIGQDTNELWLASWIGGILSITAWNIVGILYEDN